MNYNFINNNIIDYESDTNSNFIQEENDINKNFHDYNIDKEKRNFNFILFKESIKNFLKVQNSTEEISFNFLLHLQPDLNQIKENESFIIEDIINNRVNPLILSNIFFTDLFFFEEEFKGKKLNTF
jgi:hypothetical protein